MAMHPELHGCLRSRRTDTDEQSAIGGRPGCSALHQPAAIRDVELWVLAGRARNADAIHSGTDDEVRQPIERLDIQPAVVVDRRHHRREEAADSSGVPVRLFTDHAIQAPQSAVGSSA